MMRMMSSDRSSATAARMRIAIAVAVAGLLASSCAGEERKGWDPEERAEFLEMVERLAQDKPTGDAKIWIQCVKQFRQKPPSKEMITRMQCDSRAYQGLTSNLVALRKDDYFVPVMETRRDNVSEQDRTIMHLIGGTGGQIFETNLAPPPELIEASKKSDSVTYRGLKDSPMMVLLDSGYMIASVGYWGTAFRTTDTPDEIDLAAKDARIVLEYYSGTSQAEPVLLTESLGNHIALEAFGAERLEGLQNLAVVPAFDGFEHMLLAYHKETSAEQRNRNWSNFNIYKEAEGRYVFAQRRMLSTDRVTEQFVGGKDLHLRDINPQRDCSKTILGSKDYRTRRYLKNTKVLPDHVTVLDADHDVDRDAPNEMRTIYKNFVACLGR